MKADGDQEGFARKLLTPAPWNVKRLVVLSDSLWLHGIHFPEPWLFSTMPLCLVFLPALAIGSRYH